MNSEEESSLYSSTWRQLLLNVVATQRSSGNRFCRNFLKFTVKDSKQSTKQTSIKTTP